MRRRKVLLTAAFAAGLVGVAAAGNAVAKSARAQPADPAPVSAIGSTQPDKMRFVSEHDYLKMAGPEKMKQQVARAKAIAEEANRKKAPTGPDAEQARAQEVICRELPGPWYTVRTYLTNLSGDSIPIRTGKSDAQALGPDSGSNYNHASVDHNLCNDHAFAAMFGHNARPAKPTENKGDRYKYRLFLVDHDLNIDVVLTGIASNSHDGFGDKTPDARPFGMVTAYCENYTKCPNQVNLVN